MKSRKEIFDYWKNPNDGLNSPETFIRERTRQRTISLTNLVRKIKTPRDSKILELGCGVGRNLAGLRIIGYTNLWGIDINKKAIDFCKRYFPNLNAYLRVGPIEKLIINIPDNCFELVFTMAVLEHIHPISEWIFKEITRITKYLITIEDEHSKSPRHFPRNYEKIFTKFGMKQISKPHIKGLSGNFKGRVFKNESRI